MRSALLSSTLVGRLTRAAITGSLALTTACASSDEIPGYDELVSQVEGNQIGSDADHWIEMRNLAGEWEKTGLIFGYLGDSEECLNAIAGLKRVNYAREYRCTPANRPN
jgi:hypothetical protein